MGSPRSRSIRQRSHPRIVRPSPTDYVVLVSEADRIHFLDWGGPAPRTVSESGVLLVHGLAATAWAWTPVARRLRAVRRVVAADLRGHGLSDAPTVGYDATSLADDLVAVAEGSGLLGERVVLAGHGFGGIVAAWTAAALGGRCAGLVLVDGGWEDIGEVSELEPWEFLRALDEPPEVLRSMRAFLADRAAFDPPTWDADQERAARASVVEVPAGHLELAIHDHVRTATVDAMFAYRPAVTLAAISAPIVALTAVDDESGIHAQTLAAVAAARAAAGRSPIRVARFPTDGHNLMRYRPAEVAAAILAVTEGPA